MAIDAQPTSNANSPELTLVDKRNGGQFAGLLDMLPLGVCICDLSGTIVQYNHGAIELWGRTPPPGQLADAFLATLGLVPDPTGADQNTTGLVSGVLTNGTSARDRDMLIVREDGSRVAVRVNAKPLLGEAGICIGVITFWQDITGPRYIHSAQPETARQSHDLLNALPVAVYTTDVEGRITFFNQAAVALWGRTPRLGEDKWCGTHVSRWPDGQLIQSDDYPIAVALREQHPIHGSEAIAERPDGSVAHILAYPTPIWDEAGAMIGAINTLVDITEHKHNEESAQHLGAIIDSSNDAIVSKNLNGIITSWNQGAVMLFGYDASEAIGRPVMMLIPGDRQDEETGILQRIRRGERVEHYDTIRRRKDGTLVEVSLAVSPVKNATGAVVGASKIARDITERKRAAEKQILLLREMNHRVRNLFALAGSVVTLSARFAHTPKELADAVRARLSALSQAHDLTMPDLLEVAERTERQTTLRALIQTIVSPHNDAVPDGEHRVTIHGPDVAIGGSAITGVALLLHEFMTNAAKYGALSVPTGHVDATWTVQADEVHLAWRERGGPLIGDQKQVERFGSVLAQATVKGQLGGSIARDWEAAGLTVHLTVPLDRLAT
jgi:PAS domain S-box-containing protein